ncbi:MAG: regulator [Bacteroidetes bacterium HGW-Bacteroidetes-8]|jgi:DNA-binding NtrC family response regulator|nr:MAG: regulator [Bacteroidetes bacterium HGW-Bacteroidetes-8]
MEMFKIFIVEDDLWYSTLLFKHLSLNPDFQLEKFNSAKECLNNLYKKPDLVTIDFSLPDMNGKELYKKIRETNRDISAIIISGQEDINTVVDLLKEGVFDYIVKNEETADRLWNSIRLLRENLSLRRQNENLKKAVGAKYDFQKVIIGESKSLKETFSLMEKASESSITVSVTGETGTGKEMVAQAIHYNSARSGYPFIAVNLGAIPRDLVESELFGYEKGAFTGAYTRKSGIFEEAHNGTLFLDEIAEMDLNIQSKFLRVIQEKEVRRIGGNQIIKINVRLITATHKNLADEVNDGNFRADLYYRLMGLPIHLPPLRERGDDILILSKYFINQYSKENKRGTPLLSAEASEKLLKYSFPGNIRELKAIIELAIILSSNDVIEKNDIRFNPAGGSSLIDFEENKTLEEYILELVKKTLAQNNQNPTIVSKKLGISRATVYRYIKVIEQRG